MYCQECVRVLFEYLTCCDCLFGEELRRGLTGLNSVGSVMKVECQMCKDRIQTLI